MHRPASRLVRGPSRSLPVRIATAACTAALVAGIYHDGRWAVLPRAFPWRLETAGRFVLAPS